MNVKDFDQMIDKNQIIKQSFFFFVNAKCDDLSELMLNFNYLVPKLKQEHTVI